MTPEEKIQELEKEIAALRTIISLMPGNVYWKNTQGHYIGCNENMAKIYNLNSTLDVYGKTDINLMGPELAKKVMEIDNEVLLKGKEKTIEESGFNKDGSHAIYLSQKKPFYDESGELAGILGVSFNITDRKIMEEKLKVAKQRAEAANRAKSNFLAMISHELRTPLTSILGFTSLLQQEKNQEQFPEYLSHVIQSGSYLLSLINSLLDYNKLETNKYEIVNLPLNITELLQTIIDMLQGSAQIKSIPIKFYSDPGVSQHVLSNSKVLRQIFINLLGNAIKFTEKGEITVRMICLKETTENYKLEISVTDTGTGIPLKEQQSIFKRFYQLGDVYARNSSLTGTGLGLAIVKKLTKLINGKITVESKIGVGSTFKVTANFEKVNNIDNPWIPYAAAVKILVVSNQTKPKLIWSFLKNSISELSNTDEVLSALLTAEHNMEPFDIVLFNEDLSSEAIDFYAQAIRHQTNLHQPLLVTFSKTQTESRFTKVINNKEITSTQFQTLLANMWQNFKNINAITAAKKTNNTQPYVLLIEDNKLIQIIHTKMLEDLGCRVDVTDSANKTLEMLNHKYDILFVDIGLPDVAGFELIKAIRNLKTEIAEIPIIVLTGYSEDSERKHCLRVGANDVAIKPISKDYFKKVLTHYLQKTSVEPI